MPDESTATSDMPESKECDALDSVDFEALLNEVSAVLDDDSADNSETPENSESAVTSELVNASESQTDLEPSASEPEGTTSAPIEGMAVDTPEVSDETTSAHTPSQEAAESDTAEMAPSTLAPCDGQAADSAPSSDASDASDASDNPSTDETPSVPREPEDRWGAVAPVADASADTTETPADAPVRRTHVVVRLLGFALALCDLPFARLDPRIKGLLGYIAMATLVMALAVWALVLWLI